MSQDSRDRFYKADEELGSLLEGALGWNVDQLQELLSDHAKTQELLDKLREYDAAVGDAKDQIIRDAEELKTSDDPQKRKLGELLDTGVAQHAIGNLHYKAGQVQRMIELLEGILKKK